MNAKCIVDLWSFIPSSPYLGSTVFGVQRREALRLLSICPTIMVKTFWTTRVQVETLHWFEVVAEVINVRFPPWLRDSASCNTRELLQLKTHETGIHNASWMSLYQCRYRVQPRQAHEQHSPYSLWIFPTHASYSS